MLAAVGVAAGLWLGLRAPFLEVESPTPGAVVGTGGVEVVVRFPVGGRVAPETFRALLNGADVTGSFTTAENGAYGRLFGVLDGENRLRLEVFGRSWWPDSLLLEHGRELTILHRRPLDLDRG